MRRAAGYLPTLTVIDQGHFYNTTPRYNAKDTLVFLLIAGLGFSTCNKDDDDSFQGEADGMRAELVWGQEGSDIDLYLVDYPANAEALASHSEDDVYGPGEEFIFWPDDAPDGTYTFAVDWYDGNGSPVNYTLRIQSAGSAREFEGAVSESQDTRTYTVTKSGSRLEF